jgi:Tfp pilus assembly protein PilF
MEQAYRHLENKQWTEARRAFESELIVHPKNLEARYNLAILLQQAGHHDQALELYKKNIAQGWHLPTFVNLAAIYAASGDIAQARTLLEKAAKRFRNEATPFYLLADLEERAGHIDSADRWYKRALRADPLNGFAHIRYARFLAGRNRYEEALKHARRAIRLQPKCSTCLTILGDIQARSKKQDLAVESYQKSLAIKPNAETRRRLIDMLHQLGRHERANRMQQALDAWLKHQRTL